MSTEDLDYEQLDRLVDEDPIKLRDVAWAEIRRLREEYATLNGTATRMIDDGISKWTARRAERDALAAEVQALRGVNELIGQKSTGLQEACAYLAAQLERAQQVIAVADRWRWVRTPADAERALASILAAVDTQPSSESASHRYLSTSCWHALQPGLDSADAESLHAYCRSMVRQDGNGKRPGVCKFCGSICACPVCNHQPEVAGA